MLAQWYLAALGRHDRVLRSARSRHAIRLAGHSYFVTGDQLQHALDSTYTELHAAIARNPHWGSGAEGQPLMSAVAGLARRRLQARLIDELRRGHRTPDLVDLPEFADEDAQTTDSHDERDPVTSELFAELARESISTQAVVVLAGAGFSGREIALRLGIKPAAARQRLSRFGKRLRALREAA
jgi:DNA-directed RNA polymerase specialized sigma24 family protein